MLFRSVSQSRYQALAEMFFESALAIGGGQPYVEIPGRFEFFPVNEEMFDPGEQFAHHEAQILQSRRFSRAEKKKAGVFRIRRDARFEAIVKILEQYPRLLPATKEGRAEPQARVFALQTGQRRAGLPQQPVFEGVFLQVPAIGHFYFSIILTFTKFCFTVVYKNFYCNNFY